MDLHLEQEINAPADKVRKILGHQFGEIGNWASGVETSRVLDVSEVPSDFELAASAPIPGRGTTSPLGEIKEILIMYSEDKKEFTFRAAGLPGR